MYEYKCDITRVVDGDTVDAEIDLGFDIIFKSRIRLYGIDTPESRTSNKDEKARGKLAAKFLSDSILHADNIVVQTKLDKKGKFGRVLGQVWCDGVNINAKMVDEHYAVAYHGQNKADVEAEHLKNRIILKEAGIV